MPFKRFHPYRPTAAVRNQYAEVNLSVADFIYPYFVVEGTDVADPIESLWGVNRFSIDRLLVDVEGECFAGH
ncbi:MAG: hypothetical protein QM786_14250 [Breznakibacter sp.]